MADFSVAARKILERASSPNILPEQRKLLKKEAKQQALNDVFGVGHKLDSNGKPIEQGVGSSGNQTRQSIESYKKYHPSDPDFKATLERMEKEFADCERRRRSEARDDDE